MKQGNIVLGPATRTSIPTFRIPWMLLLATLL
jgi:hypothetical protein